MFLKLIKHEYLDTRRTLGLLFGGITAAQILAALFISLKIPLLNSVSTLLALFAPPILVVGATVALLVNYAKTSHGSRAYLTHSIAVRGQTIYFAKLTWTVAVITVAIAWTIALYIVAWYPLGDMLGMGIEEAWNSVTSWWNSYVSPLPGWVLPVAALWFLMSVAFSSAQFHFAMALGNEPSFTRFGRSGIVIAYVIFYVLYNAINLLVLVIPVGVVFDAGQIALANATVFDLPVPGQPAVMPLLTLLVLPLFLVALVWRTTHSWNTKISLR